MVLIFFCFLKIHFKSLVVYKYISLGDSYIEIEGDEKKVTQFIDGVLNGKKKMEISTEPLPKTPVKITKKNVKTTFNNN